LSLLLDGGIYPQFKLGANPIKFISGTNLIWSTRLENDKSAHIPPQNYHKQSSLPESE